MCLCWWIRKTTASLSVRVWWVQIRVKTRASLLCRLRRNTVFEKRDSCVTLIHFHALLRGPVAPFIKASWTELCVWLSPRRRCKSGLQFIFICSDFWQKRWKSIYCYSQLKVFGKYSTPVTTCPVRTWTLVKEQRLPAVFNLTKLKMDNLQGLRSFRSVKRQRDEC